MSQVLDKKLEEKEYVNLRQSLQKAQHELRRYPDYSHTTEMIELALLTLTMTWVERAQ